MSKGMRSFIVGGIVIFPILALEGVILHIIFPETIPTLFWVILPSIFFEEFFEVVAPVVADSMPLNALFLIVWWFLIAGVACWIWYQIRSLTRR